MNFFLHNYGSMIIYPLLALVISTILNAIYFMKTFIIDAGLYFPSAPFEVH